MSECWTVRTHPSVVSVSQNEGYLAGGQKLVIEGTGLKGTNVQVSVDGVACNVHSVTMEKIICETGAASAPSVTGVR